MSKTAVRTGNEPVTRIRDTVSPPKNDSLPAGKISPLKRLKPSADSAVAPGAASAATGGTGNADDAEVARRLHEQLNGPESPTNAPLVRHVTRQRKAPTFYKPEQFGGYGRYSGTQQEAADANGDASPTSSKQPHLSRELRRLFEQSVSMPDGHKGGQTAASGRARAHSLSEGKQGGAEDAKHRSDAKAEDDADTHSQCGAATRRHRRSATPEKPELRHTRSMQPKGGKPKQASEQRRPGGSLPAKLEQKGSGDKLALNQGSSGSPGKGGSSGGLQRLRNGKTAVEDADGRVKAEVTSSGLGNDRQLASSSGASQSQMNGTTGSDPADANVTGAEGSDSATGKLGKHAKLPAKNPMVRQKGGGYYRVRVLKEESTRVRIEFMGFEQQLEPMWLSRASERIWRGSYKNKAWKHLGDGAWAPKSGEKNTPVVAHGTHQNQYTKRKALLNIANLTADSNEAEEEEDDSGSEQEEEEEQADQCADTGFAAKTGNSKRAVQAVKDAAAIPEQDRPASSQAGVKPSRAVSGDAQNPTERAVSSKQQAGAAAAPEAQAQTQRTTRAGRKSSTGLVNGLTKDQPVAKRRQSSAKGRVVENAEHSSSEATPMDTSEPQIDTKQGSDGVDEPASPKQLAESKTEHDANTALEPKAGKKSASAALTDSAPESRSDGNITVRNNAPDAAKDQSTASETAEDEPNAVLNAAAAAAKASDKPTSESAQTDTAPSDSKAAMSKQAEHGEVDVEKAGKLNSGKEQKATAKRLQKSSAVGRNAKAPSGLEEALQCEENLAEDTSASPGTAVPAEVVRDEDEKPQAAPEAESPPRPVIKPRRDRKGRIRGTYGINAKPVDPGPPEHASDPLPLPGVTRASLRPKPIAKVNPDDEPQEAPQHASSSQRHARAHASSDVLPEQPSSPLATRASAPVEVRKPDRKAFQRRAAAANSAVAAAMAAEAADISPPHHHSSHHLPKSHSQNGRRRTGSDNMNRLGLHGVRSGQISKAQSLGGSSGAGSSGALHGPFGNLMQALEEYEAREGAVPFRQQPSYAAASAAARAMPSSNGQRYKPALFDKGSNGFVSNWHELLGSGSPRILALSSELLNGNPAHCAQSSDGSGFLRYVPPQVPLFKPYDGAG